jgi:hypothetical protein
VGETVPVLKTVPILGPLTAGAGDTNVPAATQLAGLGALPGLADLPSAALASTPPRHGANSGMSGDSFVALVIGASLAGASALMIAGQRQRDRRSGAASERVRDESSTLYPQAGTVRRCSPLPGRAQNVRTGRMIRLRRVAFLLPSALSESLESSQSPYSAWSVRIRRAASRASRDNPRGRYTTR